MQIPSYITLETTKSGGNVLVPCYPAGIVYDLIECLAGQMEINSLSTVPMYFVSPVANSSLAYSNIMAEWLSGIVIIFQILIFFF